MIYRPTSRLTESIAILYCMANKASHGNKQRKMMITIGNLTCRKVDMETLMEINGPQKNQHKNKAEL